ncbi:MAG: Formamidase [Verrucomicrobiae bacterium]|nr:Formamidase [Verrucomicrobiae bacterium]
MPQPYQVICVQPAIHPARDRKDVKANVQRIASVLEEMVFLQHRRQETRGMGKVRLIAFPEYGFSDWRKLARGLVNGLDVAVEIPGPEVEPLAIAAKQCGTYIAAQALEILPQFPNHYMNAAFIFGPNGDLVYKRHKLRHGLLTLYTSPNDILDRYMAEFGNGRSVGETVFPVADTDIGRLGMCVCHEVRTPEVARQLASNGAEVIIRPTIEPDLAGRDVLDRARAMENKVYWVVSNAGHSVEDRTTGDSGSSRIIGFRGEVIAESQVTDSTTWGTIDVDRLRASRGPSRLPLYAPAVFDYHQRPSLPPNMLGDEPPDRAKLEAEYVRLGLIPAVASN